MTIVVKAHQHWGFRAVLAIAACIAIAGCGSKAGAVQKVEAKPVLSRSEWISKADAICGRMYADVNPLQREWEDGPDGEFLTIVRVNGPKVADRTRSAVHELRALETDANTHDADLLYATWDQTADGMDRMAKAGTMADVTNIAGALPDPEVAAKYGKAAGFKTCGTNT